MRISERFLNLVRQQLNSFESDFGVEHLVVYIAQSSEGDSPSLEVVGQWPEAKKVLKPLEADTELRAPSPNRRWYPLQEGSILLGVLRAERFSSSDQWSEQLDRRLQSTAQALAHCLGLELEREKLLNELSTQRDQIGLMVHQLRNPLAALGTYAKLLLRKLGPESNHRSLVEGLINEQKQLNKYVSVLDDLSQLKLPSKDDEPSGLLLPPVFSQQKSINLKDLIEPLVERASVTANLENRYWTAPPDWPLWMQQPRSIDEGVVAEIVANLLENAFKYSSKETQIGICFDENKICVWDAGNPIETAYREKIFEKGFRGIKNTDITGSGLGLALARQLAEKINGNLKLLDKPSDFLPSLPQVGNAFLLILPKGSKIKV